MKIALYLRVSTDRQNTDSQAVELRDYCKRRGWIEVVEYCDTASGAKFSREGLDGMMRDVRKGRIDAVGRLQTGSLRPVSAAFGPAY